MTQAVREHRTLTHRNVDRRFADSAESEISFRLFYTRPSIRYSLNIRHFLVWNISHNTNLISRTSRDIKKNDFARQY